ncbi:MAG: nucleoside 2-deoxyribosyltransferase [Pseudomonadota bacterium]|nr:nucleoside 2-deoxyribosyltransferase [Pseudomonadota bacterium]
MDKCFVIQPFDGGKFDKRFEDTFSPALKAADLVPYRVDRDPGATIPIEEIQSKIAAARICLADITLDNPNVWFELGYSIASGKDVILVCSTERTGHFPFDVQHRSIIRYSTESARDFDALKKGITDRATAILSRQEELQGIRQQIEPTQVYEGLEQHELATLVTVAQELVAPDGCIPVTSVRQDMERAGFTRLATTIAIRQLTDKGLLEQTTGHDYDGDSYPAMAMTASGFSWLVNNRSTLALTKAKPPRKNTSSGFADDFADDDIPF